MIYIHSALLGKTDNFRVQHAKKRKTGLQNVKKGKFDYNSKVRMKMFQGHFNCTLMTETKNKMTWKSNQVQWNLQFSLKYFMKSQIFTIKVVTKVTLNMDIKKLISVKNIQSETFALQLNQTSLKLSTLGNQTQKKGFFNELKHIKRKSWDILSIN